MQSRSSSDNNASAAAANAEAASTTELIDIGANLDSVRQRIQKASDDGGGAAVRLVAVSKTKPVDLLMQAYRHDQRVFGENYVQELVQKASEMPADVIWHYIGPLQSNKANLLVKSVVPHASKLVVETVATLKLANKLNKAMDDVLAENADNNKHISETLDIFIQVNTSGEDSKSGVEPSDVADLCRSIREQCPRLNIRGLMTIGAPGDVSCFDTLVACRNQVMESSFSGSPLELSMGMSGDFEQAIFKGATNVRVGSTIFGARDYSNKK